MAGFSKAIQQPEYVHVLLNHLPITGLFVAWLLLLTAVVLNRRLAQYIGLVMIALLALSVWPVAHYGERAYDRVFAMSDEAGGQFLKLHRKLADRWSFVYYVTSAVAAAALVAGWKKPKLLRPASTVVAALTAASLVAGAIIADAGGKIRHREFRYSPPPASTDDSDASG